MAGRKLGDTSVHVHVPDVGTVVYLAGDEVPAEHAKLISAPDVWEKPAKGDSKPEK